MTVRAEQGGMDGKTKAVGGKNRERDFLAVLHPRGGGIGVTIQTIGIRQLIHLWSRRRSLAT
jgi:hypothetical protein